jgi:TonB family protein
MAMWRQWEGSVVDGKFPLRRYLGGSELHAAFLTEVDDSKAVIKLLPSDAQAETQLSRWESARTLSHPHLIRILDSGRWHADDGQDLLFVVMEYAEENLAEVLSSRPLTAAEASEMLSPALDALDYLHGRGMVVASIKPSNIMAVNDQLKLASDAIRPAGRSEAPPAIDRTYAAPETAGGEMTASGDTWSLGVTLVQVLTNRLPIWDGAEANDPKLPENVPAPFDDIAQHCLRRDPAHRWSTAEIRNRLGRSQINPPAGVAKQSVSPIATRNDSRLRAEAKNISSINAAEIPVARNAVTQKAMGGRLLVAAIIVLVLIIAGVLLSHHHSDPAQPASTTPVQQNAPQPAPPPQSSSTHTSEAAVGAVSHGAVVHEVLPDVSAQARNTISGTVTVRVKVDVDPSGAVSRAALASRGPSEYFANSALQAARKWTFTAPTVGGKAVSSEWNLKFEFKRSGTKVQPQRTSPRS